MIVKKRILIISNYPIKRPLHGGQKRVAAMVQEYKKVFSQVRFVAVFVREHYPVYDRGDIYLTGKWAQQIQHNHLTSDIELGKDMVESPRVRKQLEKLLLSFKPDVIQVEQVFPYIGIKQILEDLDLHPKIVYSSQNAEAPMRKEIMELGGADPRETTKAVSAIDEIETYLARNADLVTTVSKNDSEYLLSMGAKRCVMAANGISASKAPKQARDYWERFFQKRLVTHTALFVGSGHLPNMAGIKKMIGFRVGFVPTNARIIIAGGAGPNIKASFNPDDMLAVPFWRRVVNAGILSQDSLDGLLAKADVILLPIVDGGGSNLKTAEAILSGKRIVATSFAFRGYEEFLTLPNIWIADTPKGFQEAIVAAFKTPLVARTKAQAAFAKRVQWSFSLKNMVEEVAKL
jgi:hypothetical protein